MNVKIKRINEKYNDLPLPNYASEGSAGMDIYAAIDNEMVLSAGGICLVPTSLAISLEIGYECQVRSRSGLALKSGVFALNSPGTIDSDYRGELKVILANFSKNDFVINRGDRIAQLVVARYEHIDWELNEHLDDTPRGEGGFGSTGTSGVSENV